MFAKLQSSCAWKAWGHMHEAAIMQNLLELIEVYSYEYRLKKIDRIVVSVGTLSGVVPEALQFAFAAISPGTLVEGAKFVIEQIDGRSKCTGCGYEFSSGLTRWDCPECRQAAILIAGQELHLQALEGDQHED